MGTKPGEKALEAIKKLNSEVSLFKVPRVPQSKKPKMKLLTEEKYIEVRSASHYENELLSLIKCFSSQEIGKIIEKDFFPDLEKLKAQNAYLDAMQRNDVVKLRELYAKYSGKTPENRLGGK